MNEGFFCEAGADIQRSDHCFNDHCDLDWRANMAGLVRR